MEMATIQFYKNRYSYPDFTDDIVPRGTEMAITPVGVNLRSGTLSLEGTMSDFMDCNYCRIKRSGKTIWAWVEDIKFGGNDRVFLIDYRIDPWRTYRNKISLGTQFIERSPVATNKMDDLLGATKETMDIIERVHSIGNSSQRVFVIQTHVYDDETFGNTPVQPSPYRFLFKEYNIHAWTTDSDLADFIGAITGSAEPQNIVTMYSVPWFDTSFMNVVPFYVHTGGTPIKVEGFRLLQNDVGTQGAFYNETPIDFNVNINQLLTVEHNVRVIIPDAGIIDVPDYMLKEGDLYLRQDIDILSGASNYMVVSDGKYFSHSVRGSAISSIPIVSDPMETYISQNQNALATALIGDVASVAGGVWAGRAGGYAGMAMGASGGISNMVSRTMGIKDMAGYSSSPASFLGTALANEFNGLFWTNVLRQPVDNRTQVNNTFGYPMGKITSLTFPAKGFIQTQNCNVSSTDGSVPSWAIDEINSMFDRGVLVI